MSRSRADRLNDWAIAFAAISRGEQPRRNTRKDGSLPTRPVVSVAELSEHEAQDECLEWLKSRDCMVDRMNVGAGLLRRVSSSGIMGGEERGYCQYGIKYGGDLLGCLPDGRHLEIEMKKSKGGSWSKGQQERCAKVRKHHGVYLVVHGLEELKHYLRGYL